MDRDIDKKLDEHIGLIKGYAQVALTKIMKPMKYSLDDLTQEGVIAFLYAERSFMKDRNASFRTHLTNCLRNHFSNLVKRTYRNKEIVNLSFYNTFYDNEIFSMNIDALKIIQTSFIIESLGKEELEYVNTILSLVHKPKRRRRKVARETLKISYEREMELRNSIRDKIRK